MIDFDIKKQELISFSIEGNKTKNLEVHFSDKEDKLLIYLCKFFTLGFPLAFGIGGITLGSPYEIVGLWLIGISFLILLVGALSLIIYYQWLKFSANKRYKEYKLECKNAEQYWNKNPHGKLPVYIKREEENIIVYDKKTIGKNEYDYCYEVNRHELYILLYNIKTNRDSEINLTEDDLREEIETLREKIEYHNKLKEEELALK